jgi:hypothetical protein
MWQHFLLYDRATGHIVGRFSCTDHRRNDQVATDPGNAAFGVDELHPAFSEPDAWIVVAGMLKKRT